MRQVDIIEKIQEILVEAGVDVSPENYEICHRYITRSDLVVCGLFEKQLAGAGVIDSHAFQKIKEAVGPARGHVDMARHMETIDEQVASMIGAVTAAAGDAASYSASLNDGATNLGALDIGQDAVAIIADLISQTKTMSERSASLEASLASASSELSDLRSDLARAKAEGATDALTALPNRRSFDDMLADAMAEARRLNQPLSLAFGDVDHFKKFNDTWGHKLGDEVLRYVAGTLTKHFGSLGQPARFGGEEFVVLLPERSTTEAKMMTQRFCERLGSRALQTRNDGKNVGKITMSVGVATLLPDDTAESFIERADEAMYAAKKAGRNRVLCAAA
ncbi:MAG: GGDEF domain-containing protein [Sphingobium sp.]